MQGIMIVCDGGNGAGKTTVIKAITEYVTSLGRDCIVTREPGGTAIGEKIREVVLSPDTPEMKDLTELLLFSAARAQHVQEKILPAIQAGKVVISDRFAAATVSFQHYARGIDLNLINQLNSISVAGFEPTINIILDIDPVLGLQRVYSRGQGLDRMEDQKIEFLQKARKGYLEQAKATPDKFAVIDASQDLSQVVDQVINVVARFLSA
jgi:dTMP kinase